MERTFGLPDVHARRAHTCSRRSTYQMWLFNFILEDNALLPSVIEDPAT
jgi:hypothetical protein